MKKLLFIFVSISLNTVAFSQNNSKTYYSAKAINVYFMENGKVVLDKPFGNNVEVTYDNFFKSYYITFYNEKGEYSYFKYLYIRDDDAETKRMHNENKSIFHVTDTMNKNGNIIIELDQKIDGRTCFYVVSGASKK